MRSPINEPAAVATANGAPAPKATTEAPQPKLYRLADVLPSLRADADAAHEARASGIPRGPITALPALDRELNGALSPGLHWVHGNAGTGKTAFAMQVATTCYYPALFVTCEMSATEMLRRHTARATGTYLGRLKSGEMTGAEVEALATRAIEAAPGLAILDATTAAAPLQRIYEAAEITRGDAPHCLVVIDSLHSWSKTISAGLVEYEALNASVSDLVRLAQTLRAPVLVICERNRDSMKSGGLNAGAGTRSIEYSGETVLSLDRDTDSKPDGAGLVEVKLRISKNRNGAAGRAIPLAFHGALQQFEESERRPNKNGEVTVTATTRRLA